MFNNAHHFLEHVCLHSNQKASIILNSSYHSLLEFFLKVEVVWRTMGNVWEWDVESSTTGTILRSTPCTVIKGETFSNYFSIWLYSYTSMHIYIQPTHTHLNIFKLYELELKTKCELRHLFTRILFNIYKIAVYVRPSVKKPKFSRVCPWVDCK